MKKNILIICPSERDRREVSSNNEYTIIFDEFSSGEVQEALLHKGAPKSILDFNTLIEEILCRYGDENIDGVFSSDDYPGAILASIIAARLSLPGPDPLSILCCQHKYYCRIMQQRYVWEATPHFLLIDPRKIDSALFSFELPFFLKPVKGQHSINADIIESYDNIEEIISKFSLPEGYLVPFNYFIKNYTS